MGDGDINLISKIAPYNDGFTGMVDADQVIGNVLGGGFIPSSAISSNSIWEPNLKISNSPTDGYYLQYKDATDKLTWAATAITDVAWSGASGFYGFSSSADDRITSLEGNDEFDHTLYATSANIYNKTWINALSSNIDSRVDTLEANSFTHELYITSSSAISRFADSSNINRNLLNAISSNIDLKLDSLFNYSSNKGIYYPSTMGHADFLHSSNSSIHFTVDSLRDDFYPSSLGKSLMNFSSNKSLYPASSLVNRNLINSISSNLDLRIDSLFGWSANALNKYGASSHTHDDRYYTELETRTSFYPSSLGKSLMDFSANKSLYPGSSSINRGLVNSISSNLDTRIDSLFGWSANAINLYAATTNNISGLPVAQGMNPPHGYVLKWDASLTWWSAQSDLTGGGGGGASSYALINNIVGGGITPWYPDIYGVSGTGGGLNLGVLGYSTISSNAKKGYESGQRVKDLFNHLEYITSSNLSKALLNSISSNLDTRVDSLFNYSSSAKSLYADSSNIRFRFVASSISLNRYNQYIGFSSNKGLYYTSSLGHYFTNSGEKLHSSYLSSNKVYDRFDHSIYSLSSNLYNKTWINTLSGSIDGRFEVLETNSFDRTLYITSANAISRFADSSIRAKFVASSLSLQRYNQYVGHSGNTTVHVTSTDKSQWNNLLTSGNEYTSAYKSSQLLKVHSFHSIISSQYIKGYIASSVAVSKFAGSSQINRTLLNSISSNLDSRIDSIFNFSANKGLYYPSSVGKNTSGSVSKLWLWSANKSLYANSANVKYRFKPSSGIWVFASSQAISGGKGNFVYVSANNIGIRSGGAFHMVHGKIESGKNADSEFNVSLTSDRSVDMKGSTTGYINFYDTSTWQAYIRLSDGLFNTKGNIQLYGGGDIGTNTDSDLLSISDNSLKVRGAVSSQTLSGQLLALHNSRDINSWNSLTWNNSGLMWDNSLQKWKPHKSGGSSTFLDLNDTPNTYASEAWHIPVVNATETALAFADIVCTATDVVVQNGNVVWAV